MRQFTLALALCFVVSASAQDNGTPPAPDPLEGIGIQQHLDAPIPLDARFRDETGREVRLGSYFGAKPVILALVYYRCTVLCSYILSGITSGIRPLSLRPGRDFQVVAISIDPSEGPQLAAQERKRYVRSPGEAEGWHFLTGDESDIRQVAAAVGFRYRFEPRTKTFAHGSGIMLLTPSGRVSRYFYGVEYTPKDMKLGLIEASGNRIGSAVDQILLFCYHYDPATGKYGAVVMNMMRMAAGLVLTALVLSLAFMFRRDVRNHRAAVREAPNS